MPFTETLTLGPISVSLNGNVSRSINLVERKYHGLAILLLVCNVKKSFKGYLKKVVRKFIKASSKRNT